MKIYYIKSTDNNFNLSCTIKYFLRKRVKINLNKFEKGILNRNSKYLNKK